MEQETKVNRGKLFLAGDKTQHIGWVEVYNGVNVIEYTVDKSVLEEMHTLVILPIGNIFTEECFGAYDRSRHQMPY